MPAPGGLPLDEGTGDSYNALVLLRDEFGNQAVLRCLDARLTADPGFQRAFPAEVAAQAGLAEPRAVTAQKYVASATGAVVAVIRRRLQGTALARLLGRLPHGLDAQSAALVVRDVLAALEALHERGIAHRSVHPDQIVVGPDGTSALVDAGLAPRAPDDDPAAALAADLAVLPGLYAACTGGKLDGLRGVVYATLTATQGVAPGVTPGVAPGVTQGVPQGTDGLGDPELAASDDGAQAGGTAGTAMAPGAAWGPTAAGLAARLDAMTAECFDTGWQQLARAQLALAVRAHREPHLRVVELLPAGRVPRLRRPRRGSHAGARRDNRDLFAATAAVLRQTRDQLLGLWLDGAARRRVVDRAAHALRSPLNSSFSRYAAPLIAFLITFGLVVLVLSDARSNATQAMNRPTPRTTSGVARTGQPGAGVGSAPATATTPPSGARAATSGPTTAMVAPSKGAGSAAATATRISSLRITGFSYTGHGGQAQAVVEVQTSGPGAVAVTVVFAEPDDWLGPTFATKTHDYMLSGQTKYKITATLRIPHYCSFYEQVAVAVVNVTATVPSSGADSTASRKLWSDYC